MMQRFGMDPIGYGMAILIWSSCFLVGGCTALPNTRGYTNATIQIRQSVVTAGNAVETELASAISAGAVTDSSTRIEAFKGCWAQTVGSLDAMVRYAQSIEQIVDGGNKGAESAKQVADSVIGLVETVKVDAMSGAAGKVLELSMQTAAFAYGEYAKWIAAKSLEEALDLVGPSVAKVSILVQAQIADAKRLFVQQSEAQILELKGDYEEWIQHGKQLEVKQRIATNQLLGLIVPVSMPVRESLIKAIQKNEGSAWNKMSAAQRNASLEKFRELRIEQVETAMARLESARGQIAPYLEEYGTRLSQIRQRNKAGLAIIDASENAVAAWSTAYQALAQAVKERKPMSVQSLLTAVAEIRTLTQRWREL